MVWFLSAGKDEARSRGRYRGQTSIRWSVPVSWQHWYLHSHLLHSSLSSWHSLNSWQWGCLKSSQVLQLQGREFYNGEDVGAAEWGIIWEYKCSFSTVLMLENLSPIPSRELLKIQILTRPLSWSLTRSLTSTNSGPAVFPVLGV